MGEDIQSVVEQLGSKILSAPELQMDGPMREHLFTLGKAVLEFQAATRGNAGAYIRLCKLYTLRYKRAVEEQIEFAEKAIEINQHVDAVSYFCKAILKNRSPREAASLIRAMIESRDWENPGSLWLMHVYEAQACYLGKNYESFGKKVTEYKRAIPPNFNHYITRPASTVLDVALPVLQEVDGFELAIDGWPLITPVSNLNEVAKEAEYFISVSADRAYLDKYGKFFFESFMKSCSRGHCVLSVSDTSNIISNTRVTVSQYFLSGQNLGPVSSLLRMWQAAVILLTCRKPVVILDIDSVIRKDLHGLVKHGDGADLVFRLLKNVLSWEQFTGGVSVIYPTRQGFAFARGIILFCKRMLRSDRPQWWIDQNALEGAYRSLLLNGLSPRFIDIFDIRNDYLTMPTGVEEVKTQLLEKAFQELSK